MITVPEIVEEIIGKSPFLEEGLSKGIINLSSLARIIQPQIQQKLMKEIKPGAMLIDGISSERSNFFTFSAGVYETSLFVSQNLESKVKKIFQDEKLRYEMRDLSAITLILPKEAVFVPGVYYCVLKALAWQGISFVEVVSSYTELTIILQNSNVDRAFSILKQLSL